MRFVYEITHFKKDHKIASKNSSWRGFYFKMNPNQDEQKPQLNVLNFLSQSDLNLKINSLNL